MQCKEGANLGAIFCKEGAGTQGSLRYDLSGLSFSSVVKTMLGAHILL